MPRDEQSVDSNTANPEHRGDDNPPASAEAGQASARSTAAFGAGAADAFASGDPTQADTASSGTVDPDSEE